MGILTPYKQLSVHERLCYAHNITAQVDWECECQCRQEAEG